MQTKLKEIKNNEEGAALIFVMMILLVFVAIGGAVGTVTVGSHRLSDNNKNYNSAYYIAEAGANMAYAEIEAYVLEAYKNSESKSLFFDKVSFPLGHENNLKSKEYNDFIGGSRDNTKANVSIIPGAENGDTKEFRINSIGEVSGKTRMVEKKLIVNWIPKDSNGNGNIPFIPPGSSLVIRDYINFNGGDISGDIHIGSSSEKSFRLGESGNYNGNNIYTNYLGNVEDIYTAPTWRINNPDPKYTQIVNKTKHKAFDIPWDDYIKTVESIEYPNPASYPYFDAHENVRKDGNILINKSQANNYVLDFKGNYRANKLEIVSDWNLKIKTNNENVTLIVNELNIPQGNIEIIDNGTLNLFVLDNFIFGGDSEINSKGDSSNFNLYYAGNNEMKLAGNQFINGGMHIKRANLTLTGSGNLNGPILSSGTTININGGSMNSMLLLAPKANITINGGGQLQGTVIANQFKLDGGGKVTFQEFNFKKNSLISNTEEKEATTTDKLLKQGIAIEN